MDSQKIQKELIVIKEDIRHLAKEYKEDNQTLLSILRTLESLHREIREQLFEPSLPNNRHGLYSMIRDMEESGGWPYIERMRLQTLLLKLQEKQINSEPQENK
jgi:hypothetical protein